MNTTLDDGWYMVKINIRTKIIEKNFNVYALFPGQGYKHRQVMLDRGLVFLDFPDLVPPVAKVEFLSNGFTHRVARSEAIASWISGGRVSENKPMMSLSDYANTARGKRRSRYVNSLEGLYSLAKKGELVVLPAAGHYDNIVIGEFVDEPNNPIYIHPNNHYGDFKVPARRVKWIGRIPQHHVTEEFLRSIRTQNPLVLVRKSDRRQVYDSAYSSYMLGNDVFSTFSVKGETFTSRNDYFFQEFVNYAAAVAEHVNNEGSQVLNKGVTDAIWAINDRSYVPDLSININSPGIISLLSSKTTPLVASALFSLALASCEADGNVTLPVAKDITVTVGNDNNPCSVAVEKAVQASLESMGYKEWEKMCKKIHELGTEPNISAPADVEN